ncbi:MAG: pilus assembly PilX family protein [Planctomycetota bacterium]
MRAQKSYSLIRRGVVLILAMVFVAVFSVLSLSIATMSGTNLQIAENHRTANAALSATESGLEVFRYWLSDLSVSPSMSASERLTTVANDLKSSLNDANISTSFSFDGSEITISTISLGSQSNQSFTAAIQQIDTDTLQLEIIGTNGQVSRTINSRFAFVSRADPIFDYGVATSGPLHMTGNTGLEVAVKSNVYIGGGGVNHALDMQGKSKISSGVSIHESYPSISMSSNATIGGQSGQEAIDNHVATGVEEVVFPAPDVSSFAQYVQNVVDANTDTSADLTLDNVVIAAGTNPTFTGNVTLRGIVFIEQPNIVTFSGNASVTGIIIGNGDMQAPSDLNQINFSGNVSTYDVSALPVEDKFTSLQDKTGSFLLAPGFSASFSGNASIDNGVIAANGVTFSGNAGGNVQGTIMNYSQTPVSLTGNSNLFLTPTGTFNNPTGFTPVKTLEYVPSSYSVATNSCL